MIANAEANLMNLSRNVKVAGKVRVAKTFWQRTKGLLGESSLDADQALWIHGTRLVGCNSIHTWFMRFPIDVVFVDRDLKVKAVYRSLPPWRMTWPARGAVSVFELPAGTLQKAPVEIGDQLHVGN